MDSFWARSRYWLQLLFIFHFSFFIFHCGFDVEDSTPPETPIWIPKSLPEQWPESGIDPIEISGIRVEWFGNGNDNVEKYKLYRAEYFSENDSSGDFLRIAIIQNSGDESFYHIDADAKAFRTYHYYLISINDQDKKSMHSDTLTYTILPSIQLVTMIPNQRETPLRESRELSWRYIYLVEVQDYTVTIIDEFGHLISRHIFPPTNYIGRQEWWPIPDSVMLIHNQHYSWRIDLGADYMAGVEYRGAESGWANFLYIEYQN
jgi:hypothetical protein